MKKYFYKILIKEDVDIMSEAILFETYLDSYNNVIKNMICELNNNVEETIIDCIKKAPINEKIKNTGLCLKYVKMLIKLMKLNSSQDALTVIDKNDIKFKVYPYLEKHHSDIINVFGLTVQPLGEVKDKTYYTSMYNILNNIFKNWSGFELKKFEMDKKRKVL